MRLPRLPSALLPSLAVVALTLPACVDPGASRPVLEHQRATLERLERASAQDFAALRTMTAALLDARRERMLASIELDLASGALDALGNAPGEAPAWLREYSALLRDGAGADARRAPLLADERVARFDETSSALLAALDARAVSTAALFAEALADNAALLNAAGATIDLSLASREAARELWRAAVLDRIDDPAHRDAAARLLDNLLTPSAPETPADR